MQVTFGVLRGPVMPVEMGGGLCQSPVPTSWPRSSGNQGKAEFPVLIDKTRKVIDTNGQYA